MPHPAEPIDLDQLEKLTLIQCTDEEIASCLGITLLNLRGRKQNPAFAALLENGRSKGKISLRRCQFEKAQEGHPTMLIWLGKQILGQRNHVHEPTRPSAAPISVEQVRSKILGLIAKRAKRAARSGTKAPPGETEQTSQEAEARAGFPGRVSGT